MKKLSLITAILMTFIAGFSCKDVKITLKPVRVDMFAVYTRDQIPEQSKDFHDLYYSACVLHVSESNKFQLTDRDIVNFEIFTNQERFHLNIALKQNPTVRFREFTTRNSNSYIAIVINDAVNNVARIQEPITDGKVQFVIGRNRSHEIMTLLRQFFIESTFNGKNGSAFLITGL
jgi:preprotein translocase subunit SecD